MILKGKSDNYILDKEDANSFVNSKGKISTVFTGIRESDKQQVVIKEINLKTSIESIDLLIKEGEFRFNHINLVQTFDHVIIDSKLYIIREYIAGIDLKNLILSRKTRKKTSTDFFLKCGIQVCDALEYLHQENTIHCDIKPSNIIVCKNSDNYDFNNPVIKLIDYGFSTDQSSKNKIFEKQTFALMYSPPEQLLKIYSLINETSDIYSLGITLYELITGKNPFYSENPLKIMTLQMVYPLPENKKIPSDLLDILKKATYKYPLKKPPHRYNPEVLKKFVAEAQKHRYSKITELKNALQLFMNK